MGYRLAASSSAFLFFILISHTFADPQYIAVDLGIPILPFVPPNFGINDSGQFGINDSGQVVGLNQVNGQAVRTIPNGTFDTADLLPTFGRRINNAGQSAGYTQNPVFVAALNSADNHPSFQQLGTFAGNNQTGSRAFGLNNLPNPQVVGLSYGNGLIFLYHPFLWQNGATNGAPANPAMRDLGTLYTDFAGRPDLLDAAQAFAVNDSSAVVGWSYTNDGWQHAFLWTADGTSGPANNPQMRDLGTLGGRYSYAYDINNAGQVAGYAFLNPATYHAFIWTADDGMQDLQAASPSGLSTASAINDLGMVIGTMAIPSGSTPYVYQSGTMYDLNTSLDPDSDLHWSLSDAQDINNNGQIVGWGVFYPNGPSGFGTIHAFRLDPLPEPGAISLFAAFTMLLRRRNKN